MNTSLNALGFTEDLLEYQQEPFSFARIIEVNRGNYKISSGEQESIAELSGKFLYDVEENIDYPTVGDWVLAHLLDDSISIIHKLLPRTSLLKRLDPGKATEFQLIAANIDYAFIAQSVNTNFDLNRLERYLVMVNESRITPIILLTKADLITQDELEEIHRQLSHYRGKYQCLSISSLSGDGLVALKENLVIGKTYSLLGSSGVGKTTLLNALVGKELLETKEIREKDDKGKHATSRRQLVCLDEGPIFIDTPGMRELGNFDISTGIEETFDGIGHFATLCKYKDCTHTQEDGCAVLQAVEDEEISDDQYHNFMKIRKEAAHHNMAAHDRRYKGKQLSKERKLFKKNYRKK